MIVDRTGTNETGIIKLEVNKEEIVEIMGALQSRITKEKEFLKFYKSFTQEIWEGVVIKTEIERCNSKIAKLTDMLLSL